jgi:hypothetical protein
VTSAQYPIVADQNFIIATRDAGYRNLATAVGELLDNSIQAGATSLRIFVNCDRSQSFQIAVLDNGSGMHASALRRALQFGGTSRFNDRSGPGRFGMGLPNSSLSQARRVEVYTWQTARRVSFSYLDVDEVAQGMLRGIPEPQNRHLPSWVVPHSAKSGTLVVWCQCDRVPRVDSAILIDHLRANLGRIYRYYLWDGLTLFINDHQVCPIDPLLCDRRAMHSGAKEFGAPLVYTVRVPRDPKRIAQVKVRFSEFPVEKWHDLSSPDKRLQGITRQAGVSIVRGKREVAFGWFFMGGKRKENYDDWWRSEIVFDPELDEYFGVTNTKQQIVPAPELEEVLSRDLEQIARNLNGRVRSAFNNVRNDSRAARVAVSRDRLLPPPVILVGQPKDGTSTRRQAKAAGLRYGLEEVASSDDSFYSFRLTGRKLTVFLNTNHPFYRCVFHKRARDMNQERYHWECLLFALARAEAEAKNEREIDYCRRKRIRWSNALAIFLGN